MTDLATWLREQIDEDEQVAKAAQMNPVAAIGFMLEGAGHEAKAEGDEVGWGAFSWAAATVRERYAGKANLYDPARVLRQVAAFRAVLDGHKPDKNGWIYGGWEGNHLVVDSACLTCASGEYDLDGTQQHDRWPCDTLRAIASFYSTNPGYTEAVAP